jgi:hypothetical protein
MLYADEKVMINGSLIQYYDRILMKMMISQLNYDEIKQLNQSIH